MTSKKPSAIPRARPEPAHRSVRATARNASGLTIIRGSRTDHRINLTLHKLPQIIEGEALDEVIDALVTEHQAELLAAEGSA